MRTAGVAFQDKLDELGNGKLSLFRKGVYGEADGLAAGR